MDFEKTVGIAMNIKAEFDKLNSLERNSVLCTIIDYVAEMDGKRGDELIDELHPIIALVNSINIV